MIIDSIENATQYEKLLPGIAKAMKILNNKLLRLAHKPDGRYEIDSDNLFFIIQRYTTKPIEQGRLEAHQKYIDVQYVVSGKEMIGYAPTGSLEIDTPYDKETDASFYKKTDHITHLKLTSGMFSIFYPVDAHMPGCQFDGPAQVHKVVVKIRV